MEITMLKSLLQQAKAAKAAAAALSTEEKNRLLNAMADALVQQSGSILAANAADIEAARGVISEVMLDRLLLTQARIAAMANALRETASLRDPVGTVESVFQHANGMEIRKVRVPMGVIAIIYESRPNVTADAAALCIKSGNVCILRGGKEAYRSNEAIANCLCDALAACGAPRTLINFVPGTSREDANALMRARGYVDLLIPRGGAGLIAACVENATVPCIETGTGICHVYVDKDAAPAMALSILINAKTSRPSVCNAAEVCLVHRDIAAVFLPMMETAMRENGVELRLCEESRKIICGKAAELHDFDTEFLDYILSVRVVEDIESAIAHIAAHSTGHSEVIVTQNEAAADAFCRAVDSAAVYVNASTRFTDGGEFGLGCEMGISTQKLGARGPMGLYELTTYQYQIRGSGQIR
ncbi:MAG: glutamate-5-semialdehyde dehydrogenase [Oscillospiraceae bacterium]|jgi:glutamate-5-semialdehyde dehydrogenase|nr:glutamate-5-semialdehyde dehydrogenase [Oscillospiraceae bacterium]